MGHILRTFEIGDIAPEELALLFAEMDAGEQALFFAHVWKIGKTWPGAGWCQQSYAISEKLDADGRSAITTLSAHVLGAE